MWYSIFAHIHVQGSPGLSFGDRLAALLGILIVLLTVSACKKAKSDTSFNWEAQILTQLKHPNIVGLMGVFQTEDKESILVLEYCKEGNLLAYLERNEFPFNQQLDL